MFSPTMKGQVKHEFWQQYRVWCNDTQWKDLMKLVQIYGLRLGTTAPQIKDHKAINGYFFMEIYLRRDDYQAQTALKLLLRKHENRCEMP